MIFFELLGFVLLCFASVEWGDILEDCGGCPNNTVCFIHIPSWENVCLCDLGFRQSREGLCVDIDECRINGGICDDKNNTVCSNTIGSFVCECLSGYNAPEYNTSCHEIDDCKEDPFVCGVNSTCVNLPGNYRCDCHEGYTLTMNGNSTCVPVESVKLTDPNGETSVGLYVGVLFGVLAFLAIVIITIFIRRRHFNKPAKQNAKSPNQSTEDNTTSGTVYENVEPGLAKQISVEYSNNTIPQNKLDRRQNAILVLNSNDNILPSRERIQGKAVSGQSEGQEIYSGPYEEHVLPNFNNDAYNTLASCNPNSTVAIKVGDGMTQEHNPYNTLYSE